MCYSAYLIDATPGSCQHIGSSQAEQNHSSIIAFIGKEYTGELEDLLKQLLERQSFSINTNTALCKQYTLICVQTNQLILDKANSILEQASQILLFEGFKRFKII